MCERFFYHSFPRSAPNETSEQRLIRALKILRFMKEVGLVLAPEVVRWNITPITSVPETSLELMQRRICFTELTTNELTAHSETFGPIALAFNIETLINAGATPVFYTPQATSNSPRSLLNLFAVNAISHTKYVLSQLDNLKKVAESSVTSDGLAIPDDVTIQMHNTDSHANVVSNNSVPASFVRNLMNFIGFNNIPFAASIEALNVLLNVFYPADDTSHDKKLGYYRQREWRIINVGLSFGGVSIARELTESEKFKLLEIDERFWGRKLTNKIDPSNSITKARVEWALVTEPFNNFNLLDLVVEVRLPASIESEAKSILGNACRIVTTN